MKTFSADTMRSLDRRTIESGILTGEALMRNAGERAAESCLKLLRQIPSLRRIVIPAGKGNNGGDGFVMAEILSARSGLPVTLFLTVPPEDLHGDARSAWEHLPEKLRHSVRHDLRPEDLTPDTLVVDALLGTGVSGAPRGITADWIRLVRQSPSPVVSVDIPSGLNADDGSAPGEVIRADLTLTMAGVKIGMVLGSGPRYTGRILVEEIGIRKEDLESAPPGIELFGPEDAAGLLKREAGDVYKNLRGHLLITGGSSFYPSAPFLSGKSALRSGCGLVTVLLPRSAEIITPLPGALIVRRAEDDGTGIFTPSSRNALSALLPGKTAFVLGPGMTDGKSALPVLQFLLDSPLPGLLDADALNLLSRHPGLLHHPPAAERLLTPHAGEMKRLLAGFGLMPEDPVRDALNLAEKTACTVLLKGVRTVVATPDGRCSLNLSGCPALATAGSGDVLSGICGTFLAQGYSAWDAGRLGAFLHGLAGETLAPLGGRGVLADDLIDVLPSAIRTLYPLY